MESLTPLLLDPAKGEREGGATGRGAGRRDFKDERGGDVLLKEGLQLLLGMLGQERG